FICVVSLYSIALLCCIGVIRSLSCCYHAKDNLMCRDVCEQVIKHTYTYTQFLY
uniref:Uncharacterized protein n=1 Tax=Aquila chrysaetos chrysaetos TaxID=223781 RepID=A0A663EZR5_AQUCH